MPCIAAFKNAHFHLSIISLFALEPIYRLHEGICIKLFWPTFIRSPIPKTEIYSTSSHIVHLSIHSNLINTDFPGSYLYHGKQFVQIGVPLTQNFCGSVLFVSSNFHVSYVS